MKVLKCIRRMRTMAVCLSLTAVAAMMPVPAQAASLEFVGSLKELAAATATAAGADTETVYVPNVDEYLSVYEKNDSESSLRGHLYRGSACYVAKEDGEWSYIVSGDVSGWVKNSYLITGTEAEEFLDVVNPRVANVSVDELNVRSSADTGADVVTQLRAGADLAIVGSTDDWWKVRLTGDTVGYVSKEFVTVENGLFVGIPSIEEKAVKKDIEVRAEERRIAEEAARKAAEEKAAKKKAEQERKAAEKAAKQAAKKETEKKSSTTVKSSSSKSSSAKKTSSKESSSSKSNSGSGWVSLGTFKTTAYCTCATCNGAGNAGKTATGATPTVGTTVAVDRNVIPLGSKIKIGDHVYIAQDTGVHGCTIDILMSSHSGCYDYGVRYREVYIYRG